MSQDSPTRHQRAAVALTAVTVAWGTTFVLTQNFVTAVPVSSILFWRFAVAAMTLVLIRPTAVLRLSPRDRRRAVVAGGALAAGFALQSVGLQHTSATTSGFITGMFVVLTPLASAALFHDRIPPRVWWGVTLAGALAFAIQIALLAQWTTRENAFGIATVEMGVVAVAGLALTAIDGGVQVPAAADAWAGLLFLGAVASAVAFTVQAWAQSHLSATRTAVIMTGETLWAGMTGVLIAHDSVTAPTLGGRRPDPRSDVRRRDRGDDATPAPIPDGGVPPAAGVTQHGGQSRLTGPVVDTRALHTHHVDPQRGNARVKMGCRAVVSPRVPRMSGPPQPVPSPSQSHASLGTITGCGSPPAGRIAAVSHPRAGAPTGSLK